MNIDKFYWVVTILFMLVSIPMAFTMNKELHQEHPEVKPYAWGYYTGWMGSLGSTVISIFLLIAGEYLWAVVFLISAVANLFIIKRYRWAWVVGIVLQFNPILWVINGIYLKNRWAEMRGLPVDGVSNKFIKASLGNRVLIAGSVFWALIVLVFVFMFEPYGNYISSKEWWQTAKIITFPQIVAIAGYFLFHKVVKQKIKN